jgi:hypothetical protein
MAALRDLASVADATLEVAEDVSVLFAFIVFTQERPLTMFFFFFFTLPDTRAVLPGPRTRDRLDGNETRGCRRLPA